MGCVGCARLGLPAGSSLLPGALVGYLARIPVAIVASVMAFGSGVVLSAGNARGPVALSVWYG
ncbi:hypothetical protein ACIBEK_30280 [Nocardia fusca]|uniref:Uncharacterized protein n=1 Tax=Nocardia fusca TaxID=941183 RepID=A0ABV3F3F2_9NOCA